MKPLIELLQLLLSIFIKPKEPQVTQVPQAPVVEPVTAPEPVQEPIAPIVKPKDLVENISTSKPNGWLNCCVKKHFPEDQYIQQKIKKIQLVGHHSVGGSVDSSISSWLSNNERVATAFFVERDGTGYQLFDYNMWASHLYVAERANRIDMKYKKKGQLYDQISIGIELANYGPAIPRNGRFYNIYNGPIPEKNVIKLDYRGYQYWEKYTQVQIDKYEQIILEIANQIPEIKQSIKNKTDFTDIFDVNIDALEMEPGLYSHTSYRYTKSDQVPQPILLSMLNNLHTKL
jgi:hypothetical protein